MLEALSLPLADSSSNLLAARSQMAMTLGFHIVLACFGVAFPAMMLIAEYRGRRHGDADALRLAERWSKVVAVLFAVGAVSGTVLSFELGLLWPGMMGRFGDAFGIGFAIEGIFFFLEAIFIAVYIYGWKRVGGWAHFASGIPIVIAGIGGAAAVIATNSWMNTPQGFELGADGRVSDVDVAEVLLNPAFGHEFPHMWLAAYMVAGFLVASVYAVGMLRGRRDRYHYLGLVIAFTVAAVATPVQMGVGDSLARWVYDNQPAKFAAIELVPETASDVPETILGQLNEDGTVSGGFPIPGLASWLSDPSTGTATVVQGLDAFPADERPSTREVNIVHLAWDAMVGIGTLLFLVAVWYGASWIFRRRMPQSKLFLWVASSSGVLAVIAMEAGWIVTEVGRQPWIVYNHMKVEDAATGNTGVWVTFIAIVVLYLALGITTILVLRGMSRRFRRAGGFTDHDAPYAPSSPPRPPVAAEK